MSDGGLIQPTTIPAPRRIWTDAEWDRFRRSEAAGDWMAEVVGDTLELVQKSSGRTIFRARFRRELIGWKIVAAEVEGDASYDPGPPEQESQRFVLLLERFLRATG